MGVEVFKPGEMDYPDDHAAEAPARRHSARAGRAHAAALDGYVQVESLDATIDRVRASGGTVARDPR